MTRSAPSASSAPKEPLRCVSKDALLVDDSKDVRGAVAVVDVDAPAPGGWCDVSGAGATVVLRYELLFVRELRCAFARARAREGRSSGRSASGGGASFILASLRTSLLASVDEPATTAPAPAPKGFSALKESSALKGFFEIDCIMFSCSGGWFD